MDDDFIGFKANQKKIQYNSFIPSYFIEPLHYNLKMNNPIKRLNAELHSMYRFLAPRPGEHELRTHAFNRITKLLQSHYPNYHFSSFGSTSVDLFLSTSDIDIIITPNTKYEEEDSSYINKILKEVKSILLSSGFVSSIIHLSKARVPIIKCVDRELGLKFDVSVDQQLGMEQVEFIQNEIHKRPVLKKFALLLKYFLKKRMLTETKRGGLCSYAQFLMILHFFEMHPVVPLIDPEEHLGVLFMDFFQFYGMDFPYRQTAISIRDACYKYNERGSILGIEDPVDESNDVGAGCTNMNIVRDVFQHAYKIMALVFREEINPNESLLSLWMKYDFEEEKLRKLRLEKYRNMKKKIYIR
ncbi:Non-canonical poly(A) RNA polymerase protein Trf4-1 [Astathelohania contejeani]|uniref:polynucleotide adenylyltransferase n=1 Tax=Astathelohania contejeani TaxID=164912 RepID=A0ABQ7I102_9MICR|nr:Non-canonical poly(A) RNA polymerase protein Trf4-1 [Thelohania contejeani]